MQSKYKSIIGPVVEGKKIARQLGYPTMNLELVDDYELKYGIYAGYMIHDEVVYPGVISIGITPNFLVLKPKLEIHVFDFDRELYGETIKVVPVEYIRDEMKFDTVELLVKQIKADCVKAREMLSKKSQAIMETLHLTSTPGMKESILKANKEPIENFSDKIDL